MAELKFDRRELSDGEPLICVFIEYGSGIASHVLNLRGDKCKIVGMGTELTADELEQIAAKLRELNGEPNTRALDERVKELRDKLREKRVSVVAPYVGAPDLSETQIHNFEAVPWGDITRTINELFPAELKEKLKESEDENETITGIPVKTIKWEYWSFGQSHEWRVVWRDRFLATVRLHADEGGAWYELSCPNLATTGEYNTRFDDLRTAKEYAEEMVRRCGAKRMK